MGLVRHDCRKQRVGDQVLVRCASGEGGSPVAEGVDPVASEHVTKPCVLCGEDCAGRPRIKDPKGRYYHKECYEREVARLAQQAAEATPAEPAAFDPYADVGNDAASAQPAGTKPCPGCSAPLEPEAVVCIACGYNLATGGRLETAAVTAAPGPDGSTPACPLCGRTKKMHKAKLLYGVKVCKKCYYAFANRRQLAYIIDSLISVPLGFFVGMMLGVVTIALNLDPDTTDLLFTVVAWLVFPLVFFMKDGFWGYSPGKAITRVQVVDRRTLKPTGFLASLKRNLILLVPFMPLIIAFWLQRGYRLGDGWARTKVVWKKYDTHPLFTGRLACDRCHYDLSHTTTGVCPECGAPVPGT
jgi:uncharacterized RDD family membrane protein YckC